MDVESRKAWQKMKKEEEDDALGYGTIDDEDMGEVNRQKQQLINRIFGIAKSVGNQHPRPVLIEIGAGFSTGTVKLRESCKTCDIYAFDCVRQNAVYYRRKKQSDPYAHVFQACFNDRGRADGKMPIHTTKDRLQGDFNSVYKPDWLLEQNKAGPNGILGNVVSEEVSVDEVKWDQFAYYYEFGRYYGAGKNRIAVILIDTEG